MTTALQRPSLGERSLGERRGDDRRRDDPFGRFQVKSLDCGDDGEDERDIARMDLNQTVNCLKRSVRSLTSSHEDAFRFASALEQRVSALEAWLGAGAQQPCPTSPPQAPQWQDAAPEKEAAVGTAAASGQGAELESDGAKAQEQEEEQEETGQAADMTLYSFQESAWDAVVAVGMRDVGCVASATLIWVSLANVVLQIFFCFAILSHEEFMQKDHFKEAVDPMRRWRHTIAHSERWLDESGASLASRVCMQDMSLSLASGQYYLLGEINSYLSLQPEELENNGWKPGPLLCAACIMVHSMLVLGDLRINVEFFSAVMHIPGPRTRVVGNKLVSISRSRRACLIGVAAVRTLVALALLLAGVMWLSATASITNLILNAAALSFILSLDEAIYISGVPRAAKVFIEGLEPMRHAHKHSIVSAIAMTPISFALVAVSASLLVSPNVEDMLTVKRALCYGNRDFVVLNAPSGIVISRNTPDFHTTIAKDTNDFGPWNSSSSMAVRAVAELIDSKAIIEGKEPAELSAFIRDDPVTYGFGAERSLGELNPGKACVDHPKDGFVSAYQVFLSTIRATLTPDDTRSLREKPFECSDYSSDCPHMQMLRYVCPNLCGCNDPRSGIALRTSIAGCPASCEQSYQTALRASSCVDQDHLLGGDSGGFSPSWERYWKRWTSNALSYSPGHRLEIEAFAARALTGGCSSLTPSPVDGQGWCHDSPSRNSLLGLCTVTCCSSPAAWGVEASAPLLCQDICGAGNTSLPGLPATSVEGAG